MRIAVFGATGFIGKPLVVQLKAKGHQVVELDVRKSKNLTADLASVDTVFNLGGTSIFGKRWNESYKKQILESRTKGTRSIVDAMAAAKTPKTLINASAIGYYGARNDEKLDENAEPGSDFLASVCRDWEAAALQARSYGIRTTVIRIGVVLGKNGGALEQIVPPFKAFLGGPLGSGQQWFSWIHLDDIVGALLHSLDHPALEGPVNGTAPVPVPNEEFSRSLGRVLKRPSWLPTPAFLLKLVVGESAEFLLTGQRVIPKKLVESGYKFKFDSLEAALQDACSV